MATNKDEIIARLVKNLAEVITEDELRERLNSGEPLTHYIGFEISGYVHLGTGLMTGLVMKDLTDLGVQCTLWMADWHTIINEKLDGTLETAQKIGMGYFAEAMKASFLAVGGDPEKLEVRLASEWYNKDWMKYWEYVIRVSQNTTTSRMMRSIDIMGRAQGTDIDHARTIYPALQVADIFYQELALAHAGMDQRKAHVIMRDVSKKVYPGRPKPVAIHHPLLVGLQKPKTWPIPESTDEKDIITEMKMSKSKSDSAIWVHDSAAEIERKVMKAFCPEKETKYNPVLNWVGHLLLWDRQKPLTIERKEEHGGNIEFNGYEELESAYAAGDVHPMDLKAMVTKELTEMLAPVRDHFAKPEVAALKEELDKILENR